MVSCDIIDDVAWDYMLDEITAPIQVADWVAGE